MQPLERPCINVPSDWLSLPVPGYIQHPNYKIPPNFPVIDPKGAGLLSYRQGLYGSSIQVIFEQIPVGKTFSQQELLSNAEKIRTIIGDHSREDVGAQYRGVENKIITVAGVQAGYSRSLRSDLGACELAIVFRKGDYYFSAFTCFNANPGRESTILSIIDSIKIPSEIDPPNIDTLNTQGNTLPTDNSTICFEGIYQSGGTFLRFYPDGLVVNVGSTGTAKQVSRWLNRKCDICSKGQYTLKGSALNFSAISSSGKVDFAGEVRKNSLMLKWYSHINGNKGMGEYAFIPDT